jgi:hypothetical protein
MRGTIASGLFVCGTVAVLSGCGLDVDVGETSRRVEHQTVPVADVTALDVWTDNGLVDVRAGDVEDITITTTFDEPQRGDADADIEVDGNRLMVAGSCDSRWFERCAVGFEIVVPSDLDVTVTTDNGRIDVTGIAGDVALTTDNGSIDGAALTAGDVRAHTDNGSIELGMHRPAGTMVTKTDNGSIEISVPKSESGYLVEADSDNGDVTVDVTTDAYSRHTIQAISDNGDVTIRTT